MFTVYCLKCLLYLLHEICPNHRILYSPAHAKYLSLSSDAFTRDQNHRIFPSVKTDLCLARRIFAHFSLSRSFLADLTPISLTPSLQRSVSKSQPKKLRTSWPVNKCHHPYFGLHFIFPFCHVAANCLCSIFNSAFQKNFLMKKSAAFVSAKKWNESYRVKPRFTRKKCFFYKKDQLEPAKIWFGIAWKDAELLMMTFGYRFIC